MKKHILAVCIFTIGLVISINAQTSWVGIGSQRQQPAQINLVKSNIESTQIHFTLEGYSATDIRTPKGMNQLISIGNGFQITEKGAPDLPKLFSSIIIPDTDKMEVKILRSQYQEFENVEVVPSKGHFTRDINPDDVPFVFGDVYQENEFWPGKLAQLEDPFIIRDFRGQTVSIFPFQYNPVTKTLRVYTDIVVEVSSTGQAGENILSRNKGLSRLESEFRQIYNHMFLNMEYYETNKYIVDEEGSMLIIVFDAFAPAMQPFVDWKRTIGRKTEMVLKSEVGTTATAIKAFVQNYYDENENFTYLLLVGDAPQIPTMQNSSGHTDNAYGYLVGNDSYNEIFVGRFSAENIGHVETQVQRMIHYERDLNETDTWLSHGIGIARNEGTGNGHNGGENDYVHMNFIRDSLLNFTYDVVYQEYDGNVPGIPNTNAAQMSTRFNNGVSIVNFCNHGSETSWSVGGFSNTHVNQLTNVGKLPFIWSVACVNGAFVNTYCFAEAWMRATHNGEPTGAIGTMMSTINQLWQPPMTGQDEMVTILVEKRDHIKRTFGGLSINGSMKMISAHGAAGIETHDTWTLFGDPTLQVRTAAPQAFELTYNPVILIGFSEFEVNVANAEGATVALTRFNELEEEIEIIGTATVNGGTATVVFNEPLAEPGTLTMAITGFNMVTYINQEIQVIPPDGPYVIFNQLQIDDQEWNGNNQADYGETLLLDITLRNVGIDPAPGVQAVLSTENPYVTILDNEQSFGLIEEEGFVTVEGAYTVEVAEVIPNNHNVLFTLEITDEEENTWTSNFGMRIYSPMFTIAPLVVNDAQGNDNGRLDPGETADLLVRYNNTGGAPARAPIAHFDVESPYITVNSAPEQLEEIAAGSFIDVAYNVTAHSAIIEGSMFSLYFSIEDGQFVESEQSIIVGQVPETTIGTGNAVSNQYPFYNYYRANRSQMIYLASELGQGEKTILELGFNITRVATQYNNFPNFSIKLKEVEQASFTSSAYIDMTDAIEVFAAGSYQMPTVTGWHTWEIEPFEYDGESNLVVEITWGLLPQWTSTFYQVASTSQSANMVAFGYSDSNASPAINGTSSVRPNAWFAFAAEQAAEEQTVTFVVKNQLDQVVEGASLKIGSHTMHSNELGESEIVLMPGTFRYTAMAENHRPIINQFFDVSEEDENIVTVPMIRVFNMFFSVIDEWDNVLTDAIVKIGNNVYDAGRYDFDDLLPGNYTIRVEREFYFPYEGTVEIIDADKQVDIVLYADGTSVKESMQDLVKVYPNPARDNFKLLLPEGMEAEVFLVNILGETLASFQKLSGSHTISIRHLPAGHYFVRIVGKDETIVKKLSIF